MTGIRQTYPWNRVIPPFRNQPLKKRSKRVKIRKQVLKKSHQVEVIDLFRDIILQIRILNEFFCKELKFPSGSLLSMHHKVTTIVHASNCFLNLSFSEGRRHDAAMLAESGLLQDLQHHAVSPPWPPNVLIWCSSLLAQSATPTTIQKCCFNTPDARVQCQNEFCEGIR